MEHNQVFFAHVTVFAKTHAALLTRVLHWPFTFLLLSSRFDRVARKANERLADKKRPAGGLQKCNSDWHHRCLLQTHENDIELGNISFLFLLCLVFAIFLLTSFFAVYNIKRRVLACSLHPLVYIHKLASAFKGHEESGVGRF